MRRYRVKTYQYYKRVIHWVLDGHKWAVRYKRNGSGEKRRAVNAIGAARRLRLSD